MLQTPTPFVIMSDALLMIKRLQTAGKVMVGVTWASFQEDFYKQFNATFNVDASCAAARCGCWFKSTEAFALLVINAQVVWHDGI